jgi:cysteine desulfurase family protein
MTEIVYLDNASTTFPKPAEVHEFMHEFYRDYGVNPGRGTHELAFKAGEVVAETRKTLCDFFGGDEPTRLCFTYNVSDALNMIIHGILEPGDHVVTSKLEHNSVLRPLYHREQDFGLETTYVPFDGAGFVDPDDFKKAIRPNTKLALLIHGSNVLGTIQPVREVGAVCREAGVPLAVDVAQTAGIVPVSAAADYIDIVAFTGHKSLMGPTGIGGLYVASDVTIRPSRHGGTGIASEVRAHLDEYPHRLECGTLNLIGVAGLLAAQRWIASEGMENLYRHEIALWRRLRDGFAEINGVTLYAAADEGRHLPVLSCNVDGLDTFAAGERLNAEYSIACRAGVHCAPLAHEGLGTLDGGGTIRFAPGPFNTEADIDKTVEAVTDIAASAANLKRS